MNLVFFNQLPKFWTNSSAADFQHQNLRPSTYFVDKQKIRKRLLKATPDLLLIFRNKNFWEGALKNQAAVSSFLFIGVVVLLDYHRRKS